MVLVWDTAIALVSVEARCLDMKKIIADGSFLKGHTAKKIEDIDQKEVKDALVKLQWAVAKLEQLVNQTEK